MNDSPTADSKTSYDSWHAALPVDVESDAPWHHLLRKRMNPARDLRDRKVLEIGCGRGGFAVWLATRQTAENRPREVVAADFSPAALAKGREFAAAQGIENIRWLEADIQNIAQEDNTFDTVISCETIEHVPDPKRALAELARVLKPGGRLFLTCPNYFGMMGLYRVYLRLSGRPFTEGGQPINNCLLAPLTRQWVANTGLRILQIDGSGQYLPFPGRPPIRMRWLEQPSALMAWFGLHFCIVAEKPLSPSSSR